MPGILHYLRSFRHLAPLPEGDGELLQRFRLQRDELAFATLVQRHGPMVLGIARRVLGTSDTTEDVFQATFLVLARRGRHLETWPTVAGWLVQVARRTALQARAKSARRSRHEHQAAAMTDTSTTSDPQQHANQRDLAELLDAELAKLPSKYRTPLVLCQLQGQTKEETARQLGWPVGSVSGRLARGKKLLQDRLLRRGFVPTIVASALTMPQLEAHPPSLLIQATTLLASNVVHQSSKVSASAAVVLAQGVMTSMFVTKLKYAAAAMITIALCLGTGVWALSGNGELKGQAQPVRLHDLLQGEWIVEKSNATNLLTGQVGLLTGQGPSGQSVKLNQLNCWKFAGNQVYISNTWVNLMPVNMRILHFIPYEIIPFTTTDPATPSKITLADLRGIIKLQDGKIQASFEMKNHSADGPKEFRDDPGVWTVTLRRATDADRRAVDSNVQAPKIEAKASSLLQQLQGLWVVEKYNQPTKQLDVKIPAIIEPFWSFQNNIFETYHDSRFIRAGSGVFQINESVSPVTFTLDKLSGTGGVVIKLSGIVKLSEGKLYFNFKSTKESLNDFEEGPLRWTVVLRRATDYDRLEGIWRKEERNPVTDEIDSAEELIFKKNMYVRRTFHSRFEGRVRDDKPRQFVLNASTTPKQIDLDIRSAEEVNAGYANQLHNENDRTGYNRSIFINNTVKKDKILERQVGIYELKDNTFTYQISGAIPFKFENEKLVPNPQSPLNKRPTSFTPGNNATESFKSLSTTYKRVERSMRDGNNAMSSAPGNAELPFVEAKAPSSPQLQDLRQQRLKLAQERMSLWQTARAAGNPSATYEQLESISRQLLDASLALALDHDAKEKAMEEHLKVLKQIEVVAEASYKAGSKTRMDMLAVQAHRIEFEIQLEEMKAKK